MYSWSVNVTGRERRAAAEMQGATFAAIRFNQPGLPSGCTVSTRTGWMKVDDIPVGHEILTFDHGFRKVKQIRNFVIPGADKTIRRADWPLLIPRGLFGNARELILPAGQAVMLESDEAFDRFGDPFALIPVTALEGFCGARRLRPSQPTSLICMIFDSSELIYAEGEVLLLCAADAECFDPADEIYDELCFEDARALVSGLNAGQMPISQNAQPRSRPELLPA